MLEKLSKAVIKKNFKKLLYIFIFMFTMGLVGLFIAISDFNTNYVRNLQSLDHMKEQVSGLKQAVSEKEHKLAGYDFMKYKIKAFDKRYPLFSQIVDSVYQKSARYGFHPELVLSMMQVESYYNPRAISNRGAYGLMQINLAVWREELSIDRNRIFEVDYNIDLGLKILKHYYIESKGNIQRALHLYNNGYKYNNTKYLTRINETLMGAKLEELAAFNLSQ
jgi:soluble lytic murein transglycosylase-like protein